MVNRGSNTIDSADSDQNAVASQVNRMENMKEKQGTSTSNQYWYFHNTPSSAVGEPSTNQGLLSPQTSTTSRSYCHR